MDREALNARWPVPSEDEIRRKLSSEAYRVTRQNGTERPFTYKDYKTTAPGLYVDVISGEPLFSSTAKYDSGTGWPSFRSPLPGSGIRERTELDGRVEVRSGGSNAHVRSRTLRMRHERPLTKRVRPPNSSATSLRTAPCPRGSATA